MQAARLQATEVDPSMPSIRRVMPADRNDWLRMRTALWPHAIAKHPREIDEYLVDAGERSAVFVVEAEMGSGLSGFLEARLRD